MPHPGSDIAMSVVTQTSVIKLEMADTYILYYIRRNRDDFVCQFIDSTYVRT